MWYAVGFAGNQADIYEFTSRRLRDVWVADRTPWVGPRERAALTARDQLVRSTPKWMRIDGDEQAWRVLARERVERSPGLRKHREIIMYDWPASDHPRWVATAPEHEIIEWARAIEKAEASVAGE